MSKFYDKLEEICIKAIKCKWLYYIIFIIFAFIIYYKKLLNATDSLDIVENNYVNYFLISFSIFILIITSSIFIFKSKIAIHYKYFIIALLIGTCYLFASPMFTQSDESFHFIRTYQIAKGHIISPINENTNEGYDYFPKSVFETLYDDDDKYPEYKKYRDSFNESKISLDENNKVEANVRCAPYIFLNYIFNVVGVKIGMVFNLSPYLIGLFGRITGLIGCIILISIGIKRLPFCKKTMTLLLLCPVVLAYISSISADGVILSVSFLFISTILKYIHDKKILTIRNYIELLILIIFVSTCKTAYLPIIGILIFLPKENFKSNKKRIINIIFMLAIGIISSLTWMKIGNISVISPVESTSLFDKLLFFCYQLINTIFNDGLSYIQNIFAGFYLYQCQVVPFEILSIIYALLFIISLLNEKSNIEIRNINKIITGCIMLLIFVLIEYALASGNTENNAALINGVQGRYFLPILILVPFFVKNKKLKIKNYNIIFSIAMLINLYVLLTMFVTFMI